MPGRWLSSSARRSEPLHLFDANTFYPHPLSLCFLESLLPQSIQAAPILLAGGGPLAHNILVLVSFPLAGLGTFLLARELGASRAGAFLGGLGYAFCAYRFHHLVHLQSLSIQWLPLAVLFARRAALRRPAARLLCWPRCSLCFRPRAAAITPSPSPSLSASSSHGTVAYPSAGARSFPLLVALAVAAAVSGLAFVPHRLALKQQEALRGRPMTRSLEEVRQWSARWSSYANPGEHVALPHQKALLAGQERWSTRPS